MHPCSHKESEMRETVFNPYLPGNGTSPQAGSELIEVRVGDEGERHLGDIVSNVVKDHGGG